MVEDKMRQYRVGSKVKIKFDRDNIIASVDPIGVYITKVMFAKEGEVYRIKDSRGGNTYSLEGTNFSWSPYMFIGYNNKIILGGKEL